MVNFGEELKLNIMNTWKTYNKEKLDNTIEVKLYNNKIKKL